MTFIIAEVGSNWTSLEDCMDSIIAAKECGADACKFQMYTHKELYGYEDDRVISAAYVAWKSRLLMINPEFAIVEWSLPREWVPLLHAKCQEVGIEFMCTAFSADGYRFIDPYVKRHKIASAENTDLDLLTTVRDLGKPVLISTGGSTKSEVNDLIEFFPRPMKDDLTIMYCVSTYPSKNVDLNVLRRLPMGVHKTGYSCHTDEWITPLLAEGICPHLAVVEKHFKIRDMDTPDNPHSILPADFKKMVDMFKRRPGITEQMPHPDEADFVTYAKRRWIPELNGYYRTKKL